MSNKRNARPRRTRVPVIPEDNPLAKIAAATGETPRDVEAALVTLTHAGFEWDDVWSAMHDAINDGVKIVDMAAAMLTEGP